MKQLRLGFLSSHGGSNVQAIVDACKRGHVDAKPCVVISNNSNSMVLERAGREGIPHYHLSRNTHPPPEQLDRAILRTLEAHGVNIVILAGYLKLLGPRTVSRYRGYILNIHPALLPKYGGIGMHGELVHEAVLAAGERKTGVTVHVVDEDYDHGRIVAQSEVAVVEGDTPESLGARVLKREHELYVETLQRISRGDISLGKQ